MGASLVALAMDAAAIPRAAESHKREFVAISRQVWGINTPAWTAAMIETESGWRDGQVSNAGAAGLCQFIASTAAGVEAQFSGLVALGRWSPRWCYFAINLHVRDLYRLWREDRTECNAFSFAAASYNGSPSTLRREAALCAIAWPECDRREWLENVATRRDRSVVHWGENRRYVDRVRGLEAGYAGAGWGRSVCHAK